MTLIHTRATLADFPAITAAQLAEYGALEESRRKIIVEKHRPLLIIAAFRRGEITRMNAMDLLMELGDSKEDAAFETGPYKM